MTADRRAGPFPLRVLLLGTDEIDPDDLEAVDGRLSVSAVGDVPAARRRIEDEDVDCLVSACDVDDLPPATGAVPVVACVRDSDDATRALRAGATEVFRVDGDWHSAVLSTRVHGAATSAGPDQARRFLERIDDAFLALDQDLGVTDANEHAAELLGRDPESIVGGNLQEVFDRAGGLELGQVARRVLETGDPTSFERYYDPAESWFEVSIYPDPTGVSVLLRDVTDRIEREQRLRRLLTATRELMTAETPAAALETASQAATDVLGFPGTGVRRYDPDAEVLENVALGATVEDIEDRPTYDVDDSPHGEAFRRGETVVETVDDDGDPYDREAFEQTMYVPIGEYGVLSAGVVEGEFGAADRQLAELLATSTEAAVERARRRERLLEYERTLEAIAGMVYALDPEGRFSLVTDPLADRLGYDREEMVGEHVSLVVDEDDVRQGRALVENLLSEDRDSATWEVEAVTAGGERFPAEIDLAPVTDDDGAFLGTVGVVADITELAQARERIERERDRFTYLFENLPDPALEVELDDEPVIARANPAFEDTFGYDADAVVGESLNDLILPPDRRQRGHELDEKIREGETATREVRRLTADGERHFLYRGVAYDSDENAGFAIYTDITDRKRREQYLRIVGRVLRHNLRNDVGSIIGYAEVLSEHVEDPDLLTYLERIGDSAEEIADISEEARELQSVVVEGPTRRRIDVATTVRTVVETFRDRYPAATVSLDCPASLAVVADEFFEGVVEHLVENAIQHGSGEVSVRVAPDYDAGEVAVRVADDGPGIPDQERAVITGDSEITQLEHGSGLGLWYVRLVTSAYGGHLSFEDDCEGTAVVVNLDLAESSPGDE